MYLMHDLHYLHAHFRKTVLTPLVVQCIQNTILHTIQPNKFILEVPEQEMTYPLVLPCPLQEEAAQGTVQVALILERLAQL